MHPCRKNIPLVDIVDSLIWKLFQPLDKTDIALERSTEGIVNRGDIVTVVDKTSSVAAIERASDFELAPSTLCRTPSTAYLGIVSETISFQLTWIP
jgi:hypothetical protein